MTTPVPPRSLPGAVHLPLLSADRLIQELVDNWDEMAVGTDHGDRIAQHVAAAPFAVHLDEVDAYPAIVGMRRPRVPTELIRRDMSLDTLERHTASRIADGEWEPGTTTDQYLACLRAAASHRSAKVLVGYRLATRTGRCRYLAATVTESTAEGLLLPSALPESRKSLIVYYQVGTGILSGYMIKTSAAIERTEEEWKNFRLVER